jgi:hypothetical protein
MSKPSHTRYAILATLLSAALVAGCSFSRSSSSSSHSDGDEKEDAQQIQQNYPEKLLQLNEAHDKKLISDEDYQKQLKKIQKAMNK